MTLKNLRLVTLVAIVLSASVLAGCFPPAGLPREGAVR